MMLSCVMELQMVWQCQLAELVLSVVSQRNVPHHELEHGMKVAEMVLE